MAEREGNKPSLLAQLSVCLAGWLALGSWVSGLKRPRWMGMKPIHNKGSRKSLCTVDKKPKKFRKSFPHFSLPSSTAFL